MSKYGYITKYVSHEFFNATKSGQLIFSTLSALRSYEGTDEKRLTDKAEGISVLDVPCDIHNQSFTLAGMGVSNVTVIGNPNHNQTAFRVENVIDAYVFCSSIGIHDNVHHQTMKDENESLTHYIVFDLEVFIGACHRFCKGLGSDGILVMSQVDYSTRDKILPPENLSMNDPFLNKKFKGDVINKMLFHKPKDFEYENEHRIVILPKKPFGGKEFSPLFTRNFPHNIAHLFSQAVVSSGELNGYFPKTITVTKTAT